MGRHSTSRDYGEERTQLTGVQFQFDEDPEDWDRELEAPTFYSTLTPERAP